MPEWTISQHAFACQVCSAWVAAGERIARMNRRWVCEFCAKVEK